MRERERERTLKLYFKRRERERERERESVCTYFLRLLQRCAILLVNTGEHALHLAAVRAPWSTARTDARQVSG